MSFNPLNAELNQICHLLALLGDQHIFHVSGLRVKGHFSNNQHCFPDVNIECELQILCIYCTHALNSVCLPTGLVV